MMRPCLSCGTPTSATRCTPCQRAVWRRRSQTRDPRERQFYGSGAWKSLRAAVMERDHYECQQAVPMDQGRVWVTCGMPATSVHHIVPLRQRPDLALEPSNTIASCSSCQRRAQTQAEAEARR